VNDAQSGFETGMSSMAGILAGVDMLNMGGLLDALKVFDFAKAVIDDEIGQMLKRTKRGILFNEEELALKVVSQVKPGGSFMMNPHTAKRMRSEALLPRLADREAREVWEKKGALDTHARAMQRVHEILSNSNNDLIPADVDERLHQQFKGLVSGNLVKP
ncbi:MAG TPA: trimethylamine methyltransferase family protein, partial [Anaerolineales bacterium]|nr:trimethylamine methyltransferase family protein [Anaerolineales bacterium]